MASKPGAAPLLYSTELGSSLVLEGELKTSESLLVKGRFSGSISSASHVCVDRGAEAGPCELRAGSVSLRGFFSGSIEASSIELAATAKVRAELKTSTLAVAEGADFEGSIRMSGPTMHAPIVPEAGD